MDVVAETINSLFSSRHIFVGIVFLVPLVDETKRKMAVGVPFRDPVILNPRLNTLIVLFLGHSSHFLKFIMKILHFLLLLLATLAVSASN